MNLFTDREFGPRTLNSELMSTAVFNGILVVCERYYPNLAQSYPKFCPDGGGRIYDADLESFKKHVEAEIPNFSFEDLSGSQEVAPFQKYALFDFLEFFFSCLSDFSKGNYHSFFDHYHLIFSNTYTCRDSFRASINEIFQRNGLVFELSNHGQLIRRLTLGEETELERVPLTNDAIVDERIADAVQKIASPKLEDRCDALEKLWDSFERLKSLSCGDKKASINALLDKSSGEITGFRDILNDDADKLTKIGNNYQIRHFENGKIAINDPLIVDYLFFRLLSLIILFENHLHD